MDKFSARRRVGGSLRTCWRSQWVLLLVSACATIVGCAVRPADNHTEAADEVTAPSEVGITSVLTTHVTHHESGRLESWYRTDARNKMQGPFYYWYESGVLCTQCSYIDDELDGTWTSFWGSGTVRQRGAYVRGEAAGEWLDYRVDGTLKARTYYCPPEPELVITYYPNSRVNEIAEMRGATHDGTFHRYYENGQLRESGQFDMGKAVGAWRSYDQDGALLEQAERK